MFHFNEGQRLMVEITSEAANAWCRTMLKSMKSYTPKEARAVMIASLANAIDEIATSPELRAVATNIISQEK